MLKKPFKFHVYGILLLFYCFSEAYSVQDYKCLSVTSEQLLCSWSDPDTPNGYEVSQYELKYRLADGFDYYPGYGTELGKVILPPGEKEYAVGSLLPYGGYIVELVCIMSAIEGSGGMGDLLIPVNNETNEIISISTILNITQSIGMSSTVLAIDLHIYMHELNGMSCTVLFTCLYR